MDWQFLFELEKFKENRNKLRALKPSLKHDEGLRRFYDSPEIISFMLATGVTYLKSSQI